MQITNKLISDFTAEIYKGDKGARLGSAWAPWQTESSLRPLLLLFQNAVDKDKDLKWSEVEKLLSNIPHDKKQKYKDALDFLTSRKDKWDLLTGTKVKGFAKFPVIDFQEEVTIPGRGASLLIRGEGMIPGDMREIINNMVRLVPAIHQLATNDSLGQRREWFAQQSLQEVKDSLDNLDKYLNTRCERITFKRLHVGMRCDRSVVTRGLAGQVLPTVMLEGEDRPDYRKPNAYFKVPSGLNIFIGPLYFSVRNNYDAILKTPAIYRFMTLAHELTHKILKTSDKVYELPNCKGIKDSADGVMCADSWGYFLTEYVESAAFTLRQGAQNRRAMMGYDD